LEVRGDPDDFNPIFEALRKKEEQNKALVNAVQNVINSLKNDQTVGDHVRRNQIPRYYIQKHGVQTPFHVELPPPPHVSNGPVRLNEVQDLRGHLAQLRTGG